MVVRVTWLTVDGLVVADAEERDYGEKERDYKEKERSVLGEGGVRVGIGGGCRA